MRTAPRELIQRGPFWKFAPRTALACAFLVAVLGGCATTSEKGPTSSLAPLLQQASDAVAAGARDKAIVLLDRAAKENPSSKEPWLKLAELYFDSGNYPQAMIAAQEVLSRDATNQEAKGFLVVSGLRVATRATSELRGENSLSSSTRGEAERLAKSLRETLGEKVLVPAVAAGRGQPSARHDETRSAAPKQRRSKRTSKPVVRESVKQQAPASPAIKTQSSADPFGSLR